MIKTIKLMIQNKKKQVIKDNIMTHKVQTRCFLSVFMRPMFESN